MDKHTYYHLKSRNINLVLDQINPICYESKGPISTNPSYKVSEIYNDGGLYYYLKRLNNNQFNLKPKYNSTIPLNIYQTWHDDNLPPLMQQNISTLKKNNFEFNHYLFNNQSMRKFIKLNFEPDILWAFDNLIPRAYRADLFRYCVLHINGGIYLDIQYQCMNGFKLIALTESEHWVLDRPHFWDNGCIGIANALIVSQAKNQILLDAINAIVNNVKNKYYGSNTLAPTGPDLLGKIYQKYNQISNFEICYDAKISLIYQNTIILQAYPEYRIEKASIHSNDIPHYVELWRKKQIYY